MKTVYTLALLFLGMNLLAQNTFVANQGASYLAPENTLAAVNMAWQLNADAVKVNVQLSKDNRLMVIHDKSTKRTCSGKKSLDIQNTPSMLLRDLDAGKWKGDEYKGEKIPFLGEIIKTIPETKTLFIQIICNDETIAALTRSIEKSDKQSQITFMSSNWSSILEIHQAFPENKCYWLSLSKTNLKKRIAQAAEEGLTGVSIKSSHINDEIFMLAQKNKLAIMAYTDNPEEVKSLNKIGVTEIMTMRPKWLRDELEK